MEKISAIIVDDETISRNGIAKLLSEDETIGIIGQAADGPCAVKMIRKLRPDLVFLDIQMPGMDGFEVISSLNFDPLPAIVFVTAHDTYAIKAFEVQAIDYLLKPYDPQAFRKTLQRVKHRLLRSRIEDYSARLAALSEAYHRSPENNESSPEQSVFNDRLAVKIDGAVRLINVERIEWISAAEQYSEIHIGPDRCLTRENISQLEQRLSPLRFCRIHRSTIVNLAFVSQVAPVRHGDYDLTLENGVVLRVARSRTDLLQRLLKR